MSICRFNSDLLNIKFYSHVKEMRKIGDSHSGESEPNKS